MSVQQNRRGAESVSGEIALTVKASLTTQPAEGNLAGREVVQGPGCASVFGCRGVMAGLCLGGGGSCLTLAPYMPTPEYMGIAYGTGSIFTLIGAGVGGREYYVARLAKSLAEGIQALRDTHLELQGTVQGLQREVNGLDQSINLLNQTMEAIEGEVAALREQNAGLTRNNTELQGQIQKGGEELEEQKRLLTENEGQIEKNQDLIHQREAQAVQARKGLVHFEELLVKAESGHSEKKAELEAVQSHLLEVTEDLEEHLQKVKEARDELDIRIPQLEQQAMKRVQDEAEKLRRTVIEEVTEEIASMRIRGRESAKDEAKEIRDDANLEAKNIRTRAEADAQKVEASLDERSRLLTQEQEKIIDERSRMAATEGALRKEIEELREQMRSK